MGDYYGSGGTSKPQQNIDADKIFVGGLSWQTTEESLRYHFEQYGTVVSVEVMRDRVTGDPRGFAFVVFRDVETVNLVMAEPRHEINHKVVDVKRAQARGIAPPSIHHKDRPPQRDEDQPAPENAPRGMTPEQLQNKVFVGGIPPEVDRDELKRVFEQFGAVVDAIVMMDPIQRRSRGFGFVTFEQGSNGAQNAIEKQPIPMGDRHVEVKLATPKGDQQKRNPAAAQKTMGLRAGMGGSSSGEFAGLAASYGRNGWKAGYGSKAFGGAGWAIQGWDDGGPAPEKSGFSFDMLQPRHKRTLRDQEIPATKRARH